MDRRGLAAGAAGHLAAGAHTPDGNVRFVEVTPSKWPGPRHE
ncbi:hypothetical protein AB0G55_04645 [Streptomyces toyocaensis]|nr:hypothetical protein [Streptomyces toyocaensis]